MVFSAKSTSTIVSNFTRRKRVHINSSPDGLLQDYQIKLTITYETHMQTDFQDIRFSEINGDYINYWLESKTSSTTAVMWIKTDVPVSGGKDIYMYYGNPSLSDGSNITNTMMFGDDFTGSIDWATKWSSSQQSKYVISSNELVCTPPTATTGFINSQNTFSNYIVEVREKLTGVGGDFYFDNADVIGWSPSDYFLLYDPQNRVYINGVGANGAGASINNYYRLKFKLPSLGLAYGEIRTDAGVLVVSKTATPNNRTNYILILKWTTSGASPANIDWVFVRKYTANEPTTSIGYEQHQRRVPKIL